MTIGDILQFKADSRCLSCITWSLRSGHAALRGLLLIFIERGISIALC